MRRDPGNLPPHVQSASILVEGASSESRGAHLSAGAVRLHQPDRAGGADGVAPADQVTFAAARDQDLRALAHRAALGPYRLRFRETAKRYAIHVDTPDLTLIRAGVTLRFQRHAGNWEAIVDRLTDSGGRGPHDWAAHVPLIGRPRLPFFLPDGPMRLRLCALVAGRPLNAIVRVETYQRCIDVLPSGAHDDAPAIAELTLERTRVYAPGEREPYVRHVEATIRPTDGGHDDLAALGDLFRQECGLTTQSEPTLTSALKSRFGARLVAVDEPGILAHDTVETAARKIICRHLLRLRQHDPGSRIGDDSEALHDMRVAVRRLRAAVRAFPAGFPARMLKRFTQELRWLGSITGPVRDLDVQLARLHQHSMALPRGHRAGLSSLHEHMQVERARLRGELQCGLESQRYFDLLIRLEGYAYGQPRVHPHDAAAREPIASAGAQKIRRALRRLLKRGTAVRGAPTPEDLHALRIRAKQLRYLLEFLQELTGKRGRRLVKRLVELQDLLGTYHDAIVTAEMVRQFAEGMGAQLGAGSLLTLGAVASSALHVAEDKCRDFERTWKRFARKRTRKEFRLVVEQLAGLGATSHGGGDASPEDSPHEPPAAGESTPSKIVSSATQERAEVTGAPPTEPEGA